VSHPYRVAVPSGYDGTNQAVECEDVYADAPSSGTVDVFPVAEGYSRRARYESVDGFLAEYFALWAGQAIGIGADPDLTD
jgi:hypothetical protein